MTDETTPEIGHATDGALRVARRQMIQSARLAAKAEDRLGLQEHGDPTQEGVEWKVTANIANGWSSVDLIERELDRRGADYRAREDVADSV